MPYCKDVPTTFRFFDKVRVNGRLAHVWDWQGGHSFDEYDISGVHDPLRVQVEYSSGCLEWVPTYKVEHAGG